MHSTDPLVQNFYADKDKEQTDETHSRIRGGLATEAATATDGHSPTAMGAQSTVTGEENIIDSNQQLRAETDPMFPNLGVKSSEEIKTAAQSKSNLRGHFIPYNHQSQCGPRKKNNLEGRLLSNDYA
jgi:hypothetical protein